MKKVIIDGVEGTWTPNEEVTVSKEHFTNIYSDTTGYFSHRNIEDCKSKNDRSRKCLGILHVKEMSNGDTLVELLDVE